MKAMTDLQKAVFDITREFVDHVKKPMINKYLEMQEFDDKKFLIHTLLEKYIVEAARAEKDMQRDFEYYIEHKTGQLEVSCLNHAYHYKIAIIDILQGKVC